MAAELTRPTDEETGLPYAILIYDVPNQDFRTYDHHFHPRVALEPDLSGILRPDPADASRMLPITRFVGTKPKTSVIRLIDTNRLTPNDLSLGEIADLAVRMCRGQLLPDAIHKEVHRRYVRADLPEALDEKFETFVRAYSGLVSRWAVDMRRPGNNALVYMSDDVYAQVTDPGVLCYERAYYKRPAYLRRRFFANFMLRYAMAQDLEYAVSPRVIEEFVESSDATRRRELGHFILSEALDIKLDPIVPIHQKLLRGNQVQAGRRDPRSSIRELVRFRLDTYLPLLTTRLTESPVAA